MNKKIIFMIMVILLILSGCNKGDESKETGQSNGSEIHTMDDLIADPDFDFSMTQDIEVKIVNKKMAYEYFDLCTADPTNGGSSFMTNAYFDKDGLFLYKLRIATTQKSLYIKSKNENMESKTINIVNGKAYYTYE